MQHKITKLILVVLIVVVFMVAAYWGGAETGQILNKKDHSDFFKQREKSTMAILTKMQTLEVGAKLPDFDFFETLESETVKLSDIVKGPTLLNFMQPDCPACLEELEHLQPLLQDDNMIDKIVIISSSNPLDLIDIRSHFNIRGQILHDRNNTYIDQIRIYTYPFNIIVDTGLIIKQITADQLLISDLGILR